MTPKFMEKEDARKQSREVLHERRKQVIRLHRKGVGVMQIVEQTGLSWSGVNTALRLFEQGGAAALKPNARGKKLGSGRSLSAEQERVIRMTIIDKRPEQIKMEFALWSRPAVRELIERDLGLKLSVRAVGDYLARWGFTPQKPIKKPTSRGLRPSRPGSKMNTPPSRPGPSVKAQRSIGVMKRPWSTQMCVAEVMHQQARRR